MKNYNIKNILLYIVLLPYVILLFMCIYHALIGYGYYLGNTAYGIIAVVNFLKEFFNNVISWCYNPIILFIIVLWISYQIYYFISYRSYNEKQVEHFEKNNGKTLKNINLKKILFFISILCWFIYFASGIFAFFFGANFGGRIA